MGKSTGDALLSRMTQEGEQVARKDSWVNYALGFGTSRDKTGGTVYGSVDRLQDEVLRSLYASNDYAAKIVNIYPREAMRTGYAISGFDAEKNKKAEKFVKPWNLNAFITNSEIWARLFGGGVAWFGTDDGAMPEQPLGVYKKVAFIKFYDRRYIRPYTYYASGPKVGEPETYMLYGMNNVSAAIAVIHETRLVLFSGARTEAQSKREMQGWDYSVLQVAYEALRSEGSIWKAVELLVSDANQAVFRIQNLWAKMATPKGEELRTRIRMMDLARSVSRAILLDKDNEDFERKMTTFSGLPELSDKGVLRVASAAEMPVTLLMGQAPAGLNATGDSDLRWFFARVQSYRQQEVEPKALQILNILFKQEGSPIGPNELDDLALRWHPLWDATAKERAEIYKLRADAGVAQVGAQIVLPEEVAVSEYGGEEGGELQINVKARQRILKSEATKLEELTPDDAAKPDAKTAGEPSKDEPVLADPNAEAKDPTTALNGAQVTALLAIVQAVADETLPRDSGISMIVAAFPISPENAEKIMGSVGKGFVPKKPEPVAPPFGAPPVAKQGDPPTDIQPKKEPTDAAPPEKK